MFEFVDSHPFLFRNKQKSIHKSGFTRKNGKKEKSSTLRPKSTTRLLFLGFDMSESAITAAKCPSRIVKSRTLKQTKTKKDQQEACTRLFLKIKPLFVFIMYLKMKEAADMSLRMTRAPRINAGTSKDRNRIQRRATAHI
ncbi:hypothetical protein SD70_12360 [Gordoniibacillus kamchatkensis]|uniref:Uncharacterized protein n=1 Tax=Gordoniibacillus kamchatkensis TaxID=1590651 RepID=A0ABR5AHL4_9BACL|nr:hypothetical protein SD70_12360 [Paenibacillus sp. VKM B-2647]